VEATNRASVDAVAAAHIWSVHPLRHEPLQRSVLLLGLIGGASGLAAIAMGGPLYGILSLMVLLGSTARYLLPTRYRVDAAGAAAHLLTWRRQPWSAVRRIDRHADGLFLSPFVRPSRLDTFRGLFLPFGEGVDGAALTAYVESRVAA
jgi:hypothetical protein